MDRGNTKQEILEASLDLFSVQGFEATSISQIVWISMRNIPFLQGRIGINSPIQRTNRR